MIFKYLIPLSTFRKRHHHLSHPKEDHENLHSRQAFLQTLLHFAMVSIVEKTRRMIKQRVPYLSS